MQQPSTVPTISLYSIVQHLIFKSHLSLKKLAEELSTSPNDRKKQLLHDYFQKTREYFIRLLVLIRWSQKIQNVDKCKNIISTLDGQLSAFQLSADTLFGTDQTIKMLREPVFDIPTAIDVFTTGTFSRLPEVIQVSCNSMY